jgi:hypothetical protein
VTPKTLFEFPLGYTHPRLRTHGRREKDDKKSGNAQKDTLGQRTILPCKGSEVYFVVAVAVVVVQLLSLAFVVDVANVQWLQ